MTIEKLRKVLSKHGLHEKSVERLLHNYKLMRKRAHEGNYEEVAVHIGKFCENLVNVLRSQMDESIQSKPNVSDFISQCNDEIGQSEPNSIKFELPQMLRVAYNIRSHRDAVHVNLKTPISRLDAHTGIVLCSWMLAEVIRVYCIDSDDKNLDEVITVINQLSDPPKENPLKTIEASRYEFDHHAVSETLNGVVSIVEESGAIKPRQKFEDYSTKKKLVVVLLARQAAHKLEYVDQVGMMQTSLEEYVSISRKTVKSRLEDMDFVLNDRSDEGGYYIPGYRAHEGIKFLEKSEEDNDD